MSQEKTIAENRAEIEEQEEQINELNQKVAEEHRKWIDTYDEL